MGHPARVGEIRLQYIILLIMCDPCLVLQDALVAVLDIAEGGKLGPCREPQECADADC